MNALESFSIASVLACTAAAATAAAGIGSDQFAPGWQAHARSLINAGPARLDLSKTSWHVPGITPPGRYVLIERRGEQAELIPGYEFKVTPAVNSEIHMIVPANYADVEALPLEDVPALAGRSSPAGSR
jgi:hypothetical protein